MRLRPLVALAALVVAGTVLAGCGAGTSEPPTASGCDANPSLEPGMSIPLAVTVDGAARGYTVHVPATMTAQTSMPLILAFAGYRMPPGQLEQLSGLDGSGAIVVYPQAASTAAGVGWQGAPYSSGEDDVAFTAALLDDVESRLCIDPKRVFAAGISNGGGFVSLLSCALPERIAAFAVVSGAIYPATNPPCASGSPVPVVEFHGTADDVIPYDGGIRHDATVAPVSLWLSQVATRNGCAADPRSESVATGVERQTWTGCHDRGALVHYRIDGGGHVWPGAAGSGETAISATTLIETFFTAHPLP
ncbi:alpha/beta hydrolase family esterase [Microbacterium testaceum]|uniref:alpha/beta hydrolase family esterase n=1 Tax=Microbacterium testaceum TaxID=2033 RepID=UPI002AC6AD02|nr:PHB depolymerase family esterase [Microbacterium testaceum]MDZ5145413.1 poly(3-hydroxybutyrate) depolymerase [Microbacterium testaceum]